MLNTLNIKIKQKLKRIRRCAITSAKLFRIFHNRQKEYTSKFKEGLNCKKGRYDKVLSHKVAVEH